MGMERVKNSFAKCTALREFPFVWDAKTVTGK
jgi:hypothetical protein